jgi:hypothetical protein
MPRERWHRRKRRRRSLQERRQLSLTQILVWADAHYARTDRWPQVYTGPVYNGPLGEKWRKLDNALRYGLRGLPGRSSLRRLLSQYRGVRNNQHLAPLTEAQVLKWARAHYRRTGTWPNDQSGPITDQPGEVWHNVNAALRMGRRGLPGNSSLAKLLADRLGVRTRANLPLLSIPLILTLADAHFRRTGRWPTRRSGPVVDAPSETWRAIDLALNRGYRGLWGGRSLPQLLATHRGLHSSTSVIRLRTRPVEE